VWLKISSASTLVAGCLQWHQQQVIAYLQEENRLLKAQLDGRQLDLLVPRPVRH
jgi:hypothetical protein